MRARVPSPAGPAATASIGADRGGSAVTRPSWPTAPENGPSRALGPTWASVALGRRVPAAALGVDRRCQPRVGSEPATGRHPAERAIRGWRAGSGRRGRDTTVARGTSTHPAEAAPASTCRKNAEPAPATGFAVLYPITTA